ncbi:RNA-directed DNA polymerase from transposon x-element [Fusarium oxysporum f. sp. phaseoli]
MASSSTIPPAALDPFDLGIHTPINLNRGARAALLQNSPVVVNATEGAERASPVSTFEQRPISIVESANDLAREHAEEYNTKLMVFRAFCTKFEEAAQQFVTGPQRRFAQQFADDFLGFWKRELSCSGPVTPKPTYSSVVTAAPPTDHDPKASGRPARKGGRPASLVDGGVRDAAAAFRAIRRSYPLGFNQDVQIAKRGFHRVVRRAKRRYWRNLIDGFSSSSDVFKAVRAKMDKANALRQATLERRTAEDDIANAWTPVFPPRSIPFSRNLSGGGAICDLSHRQYIPRVRQHHSQAS